MRSRATAWRWIDYRGMPEAEEREHIRMTVATIRDICGRGAARLVHWPLQRQHAPAGHGGDRDALQLRRL